MIDISLHKYLWTTEGELSLALDVEIASGEMIALYGQSGAGKTTILRILSGLDQPNQGRIQVDGQLWLDTSKNISLPPQARNIGFVFQDFALFPHMTVQGNLKFALAPDQPLSFVDEILKMTELGQLSDRKPYQLSGGQKQRVALARAIVQRPKLLLLDEPLSALDSQMRRKLQDYILKIHRELKLTTVLVSHDLPEIFKLANRVIHLHRGQVKSFGSPMEVFQNQSVSGKFQFVGEIISLVPQEFLWIVGLSIGNDIVRIIIDEHEATQLKLGDTVLVASKAFNPIIKKIQ